MSLILDALKKSEAERQRGQPPTLHAHFSAPRRTRRMPWAVGAGAVLLAAGLAGSGLWLARGRGGEVVDAGNAVASAGVPAADAPVHGADNAALATPPVPAPNPVQAPTAPALADAAAVAAPSPPIQEAVLGGVAGNGDGGTVSGGGLPVPERAMMYTPSAVPGTETAANPPAPSVPPPPEPAVAVTPATGEPPAAMPPPEPPPAVHVVDHGPSGPTTVESAPVSKPEEVLPVVFQLPYATRKDMPKLELSMHVFSPDPLERFIVLNGKRYTLETPAPGPELTLLDIVADGAVFEFRGQRFLLPRQTY